MTPVVRPLPRTPPCSTSAAPPAASAVTPAELAELIRVRALARYGVDCTVGIAANPLLARRGRAGTDRRARRHA
ncbi:hypothetical protein [Streptomyces thioluteus]|uniref:hypothetical protein n=1 Tax=Streptomyces thioluteus TaxID=66431 RepID=UPI0031EEF925